MHAVAVSCGIRPRGAEWRRGSTLPRRCMSRSKRSIPNPFRLQGSLDAPSWLVITRLGEHEGISSCGEEGCRLPTGLCDVVLADPPPPHAAGCPGASRSRGVLGPDQPHQVTQARGGVISTTTGDVARSWRHPKGGTRPASNGEQLRRGEPHLDRVACDELQAIGFSILTE